MPPLKLTQIVFDQQMKGRFGTGKETDKTETRWADFHGNVEVLNAKVARREGDVRLRPPTRRRLHVPDLAGHPGHQRAAPARGAQSAARNFPQGLGRTPRPRPATIETISADKITYDSLNDLFYAYGLDGRPVLFAQQSTQAGQPSHDRQGRPLLQYNRKTGESELIGPLAGAQLIDAKTGIRPGPACPTEVEDPKEAAPRR